MTPSRCEHEESIVRAIHSGGHDEEIAAHLEGCKDCRLAADLARALHDQTSCAPPPSAVAEEARRLWHISRAADPAATRRLVRRWQIVRILAMAVPPLTVLFAMRRSIALREPAAEVMRTLESALGSTANHLSFDIAAICTAALLALTILATWRLTLSD